MPTTPALSWSKPSGFRSSVSVVSTIKPCGSGLRPGCSRRARLHRRLPRRTQGPASKSGIGRALDEVPEGQDVACIGNAAGGKEGLRPGVESSLANGMLAVWQYLTNDEARWPADQAYDIADLDGPRGHCYQLARHDSFRHSGAAFKAVPHHDALVAGNDLVRGSQPLAIIFCSDFASLRANKRQCVLISAVPIWEGASIDVDGDSLILFSCRIQTEIGYGPVSRGFVFLGGTLP
jgi:hypothetical protein